MSRWKGLTALDDVIVVASAFQIVRVRLARWRIPIWKAAKEEVRSGPPIPVLDQIRRDPVHPHSERSGKNARHEIKLGRLAVLLLVDVLEVASRDYSEGAKHDKREKPGSWEQIGRHCLRRELVEPPFFVLDDPEEWRRPFCDEKDEKEY